MGYIDRAAELLNDPDRLYTLVKKAVGMAIGLSVAAVGGSFAAYYVQTGAPVQVFVSIALAWFGYVMAHYAATGKFIHQKQEQSIVPRNPLKILGGLCGVFVLISGATIWTIFVGRSDMFYAIIGAFLVLSGYVIAHYELTGDLL